MKNLLILPTYMYLGLAPSQWGFGGTGVYGGTGVPAAEYI